jgi:hypothetical protein
MFLKPEQRGFIKLFNEDRNTFFYVIKTINVDEIYGFFTYPIFLKCKSIKLLEIIIKKGYVFSYDNISILVLKNVILKNKDMFIFLTKNYIFNKEELTILKNHTDTSYYDFYILDDKLKEHIKNDSLYKYGKIDMLIYNFYTEKIGVNNARIKYHYVTLESICEAANKYNIKIDKALTIKYLNSNSVMLLYNNIDKLLLDKDVIIEFIKLGFYKKEWVNKYDLNFHLLNKIINENIKYIVEYFDYYKYQTTYCFINYIKMFDDLKPMNFKDCQLKRIIKVYFKQYMKRNNRAKSVDYSYFKNSVEEKNKIWELLNEHKSLLKKYDIRIFKDRHNNMQWRYYGSLKEIIN